MSRQISGKTVQAIKERYARVRASLQSKGTLGSRRVLRRLNTFMFLAFRKV